MIENVTVVIPSHNTLNHLKNTYTSIRKYYPTLPLIIIDDASTDGTDTWLSSLNDKHSTVVVDSVRKGHTFWYDEGMRMSKTDIVAILHSDMIIGPNYFENLLKHLKPKTIVCATRIEPPIHPSGLEKIVQNFGMDYSDIQWDNFEKFCLTTQQEQKDVTTKGIFAPWILFKEDHLSIGGHDQNFAPYGYEDSDIFNRWILAGYQMVQSRDALVYHLTCRGHRWNKGVGIENDDYRETMDKGQKYFLRKWGQWIQNDEYMFPIIHPKYNIRLIILNLKDINFLRFFEPLFSNILCSNQTLVEQYIKEEQPKTTIDLSKRISTFLATMNLKEYDVNIIIDTDTFTDNDMKILQQFHMILNQFKKDTERTEVNGVYELGTMRIHINSLEDTITSLIYYKHDE